MSELKLYKKYYWKELSSDGLLKDPPKIGPYYDEAELNNYVHGYDTPEEAEQDLLSKKDFEGYHLILIQEVRMLDSDWYN